MENLSILNLFNGVDLKIEAPKQAPVKQGEFENVFKKYLDRAEERPAPKKPDTTQKNNAESVKAEEPKTPEEVIDNLNISEDVKKELKQQLAEVKNEEDASELLDEMTLAIEMAGGSKEQVDIALTEMATTILSSEPEKGGVQSALLEATLDKIVANQNVQKQQNPQLTAIKGGAAEQEQNPEKGDKAAFDMSDELVEELPADIEKILSEIEGKPSGDKTVKSDFGGELHLKSETTEKVIKAEIKIESPKDIMKFAEMVELAKNQKANKINLQLHPQELGKVNIELVEQSGRITGKVIFESETTRNLFANNIDGLKQQLAEKGVVVESLDFLFQDFDQHEFAGWENQKGNKEGKSGSNSSGDVLAEEEEIESDESDIYA